MADPNVGQLVASVWEGVVGKKPTDNIYGSRALFFALGEQGFKEELDGGRLIEFPLEYAENSSFHSYNELDTLDTTRYDTYDAARFDWKICAGTVVISDLERLRNQGKAGKFDLLAEKLESAKDSHIADMNRQLFGDGTGNGGADLGGIKAIIPQDPTTGSVGGINRAVFSFWRSQTLTGAGSSFSILRASMRTVYNKCSRGGTKEAPTAIITDRPSFEGYESLTTTLERYNKDGKTPRGFDLSFDNNAVQFKGADVFYDEDCTAGNMYFLNPKFLKFAYLSGGWMKMSEQIQPANQLTSVYKLATFGNLGTSESRRLGLVYSIA